jgi:phage terminase large subunit GpA-like protein
LAPESAWKKGNQRAGAWKHQNPDQRAHLGYHLNQLASAHRSWYAIVCEWLDIQNSTEIEKQENLKVFINTVLAELWEDVVFKHDHSDIYKRREKYDAELPDDVCLLTMGVDIQKGWLEFEIVGWGATGTWGIIHQKLYGNLSESFIWDQLDLFRRREYKFASGEGLYIYGTGIDTGYDSQRVYDYVAARESERVYGTKGSNNINAPVFAGKSLTADKKCTLYTIGVGALKENLMNSVDIAPGNVGYLHFPKNKEKGYDEEYCKGLMAEHKEEKNGKMQWVQHYKRNEPIDCRNEATFPLYINGINIVNISKLTREQQREISAKGYIMYDAPARKKIVDEGLE